MNQLTEKDAATSFARAWNKLEPSEFLELLAPDATYESQWVFDKLMGKEAITDYLVGKMQTVKEYALRDENVKVNAEVAQTT